MKCIKHLIIAAICVASLSTSRADLLFDNMSNYENSVPGAGIAVTGSTPNTFMGAGYNLLAGASTITGFDIYPANLSGNNYNALRISIYVWGNVNTGTVSASTPAFANLLANYTLTSTGTFSTGFFFPFEGTPIAVNPGITLGTPLSIPSSQIGLTFNYQGSTDGGVTYNNVNSLTSLISDGTPASVGSLVFNGYYRNANNEVDGNFTSTLRSLGGTPPPSNQGLGVRIYGTVVPEPSSMALIGFGLASALIFRRRK